MKLTPKLRFKDFSKNWRTANFLSFLEEEDSIAYGVLQPGNDLEGGIPMLRTVDLDDFGLKSSTKLLRIPEELDEQYRRTRLQGGELIISVMGTLGRVIIVPKEWSGWNVNRALAVARLNKSIDRGFLIQILRSPQFEKKVIKEALGSAQKRINLGDLKEYMFTFPSLPEQQKIASFLSAVDEKIQQLTRKKELLKQYKKGMMQQLFSGKLRFKDESGKAYPKWEEKKLAGEVEEFAKKSTINDEFIVLTSSNKGLMKQGDYYGENRLTERENIGFNIVPENHVTYRSRSDNRQFTFNLNDLGIIGIVSTYYPVFSFKKCDPRFMVTLLNFNKHHVGVYSVGTSQTVLSFNELKKVKFWLPGVEEQQKIASFLAALDAKIESVATQIAHTQTFKKGLLQQMFV